MGYFSSILSGVVSQPHSLHMALLLFPRAPAAADAVGGAGSTGPGGCGDGQRRPAATGRAVVLPSTTAAATMPSPRAKCRTLSVIDRDEVRGAVLVDQDAVHGEREVGDAGSEQERPVSGRGAGRSPADDPERQAHQGVQDADVEQAEQLALAVVAGQYSWA